MKQRNPRPGKFRPNKQKPQRQFSPFAKEKPRQPRFERETRVLKSSDQLIFGGRRAVAEALKSRMVKVRQIYCTEAAMARPEVEALIEAAAAVGAPLTVSDAGSMNEMVGSENHQGVACRIHALPEITMEALLAADPKGNLLALDQVQDPMNLGAILRSANAFGVKAVICPKDHSAPLRETAIKASAGAAMHTPVLYVTNLARALEQLKEAGYWVVALLPPDDQEADTTGYDKIQPLPQLTPPVPWVLLAGSEGSGLRPLVARGADFRVMIPLRGEVDSLNVSAACATALFYLQLSDKPKS